MIDLCLPRSIELVKDHFVSFLRRFAFEDIVDGVICSQLSVLNQICLQLTSNGPLSLNFRDGAFSLRAVGPQLVIVKLINYL